MPPRREARAARRPRAEKLLARASRLPADDSCSSPIDAEHGVDRRLRACDSCGATKQTATSRGMGYSFVVRRVGFDVLLRGGALIASRAALRSPRRRRGRDPRENARPRGSRRRGSRRPTLSPRSRHGEVLDVELHPAGEVSASPSARRSTAATGARDRLHDVACLGAAKANDADASFATSNTHTWIDPLGSKPKLTNKHEPSALVLTSVVRSKRRSTPGKSRAHFGAKSKRADWMTAPPGTNIARPINLPRVFCVGSEKPRSRSQSKHDTEPCALSYASASRGAPPGSHTSTAPATAAVRLAEKLAGPARPRQSLRADRRACSASQRSISLLVQACVLSPVSRTTLAFAEA